MLPSMEIIALYIGLATVIGSIVGAFISTLLGRFQTVSSFRQDWINSLRLTFAEILLQCEKYTDIAYQDNSEAYLEKIELVRAISKVKLFLNINEELSSSLIGKIENIPKDFMGKKGGTDDFAIIKPEIEILMQNILKEEWNRVRDGEIIWKLKKFSKAGNFLKSNSYPRWQIIFLFLLLLALEYLLLCTAL
ncbi:MAG: hypothetical protein KJ856_21295 [Gammaproteobacteria bacterium]|nr:hypothetical protein [Gammaproteobacteria bacterium]MBU1479264.1 hypothetical protein [Gammaproteobacteria bacterium]MBU2002265.1 hypothetical protein [Gammaproteobacteria bacterium]MBU2132138.1 hypothetical protein [Gammaproteobacteria bacterium]MBU2189519.1 hypothetical protein [Gammaproteobacteria bacterium]